MFTVKEIALISTNIQLAVTAYEAVLDNEFKLINFPADCFPCKIRELLYTGNVC